MKSLRLSKLLVFYLGCILFCGCHPSHPPKSPPLKTYRVTPMLARKTLYFTGTIQPLQETLLTCPADAIVGKIHYHYGQSVKRGDIIFSLYSSQLQKQYTQALTAYLKTKDNYSLTIARFQGTKELWDAGLISKNNYLSEQSNLRTAHMALLQDHQTLNEITKKMGGEVGNHNIALNMTEFKKIHTALNKPHHLINLTSPSDGILLYPPKSLEEKTARISVGSNVKTDQVLALIGDLQGIQVEIDIPETDIGKIKIGMSAHIHGIAFEKHPLHGTIIAINPQASHGDNGSLPSFTAIVRVEHITPSEQMDIKVGMSASVELITEEAHALMVPIAAVIQHHGQSTVQHPTPTGKIALIPIETGPVYEQNVIVRKGLREGDEILYG